jgi:o-succinylbenzoate synthase
MNATHFTFTEYDIPFRTPLKTARGDLKSRRGFLVAAHGPQGEVGVGEVATLPEFGTEGFVAARNILQQLVSFHTEWEAADSYLDSLVLSFVTKLNPPRHPATIFGIDSALLGLSRALEYPRQSGGTNIVDCTSPFPVNTLIFGSTADEILETAQQRRAVGFQTQKLKVGVLPVEEELRAVRRIRVVLPDVNLRLDANCAWNIDQAIDFCSKVEPLGIDYIEDPVNSPDALATLRQCCGIRIAVDGLWTPEHILSDAVNWTLCDVLVLKPARIGSHNLIKEIQTAAQNHGVQTVYTTMFDTSIGIACTLGIMREFADHDIAHGLDTGRLLASDTLMHHLIPDQGMLHVLDLASLPGLVSEPYRKELGLRS